MFSLKPILWIFVGGGLTIVGGIITLVATYYHNRNSSAKTDRIESGISAANTKADQLLIENKGLQVDLSNARTSLEVQEGHIRELSGKLDPFIELAKSKHPGKNDAEALDLLKKELNKVSNEVEKTKDKYIPKVSDFKITSNNTPSKVYMDANKTGEFDATNLGVDVLYKSAIEVNYSTQLKRTDVTFEVTSDDVVAGYVELLSGGILMYIRGQFTDNGNCAFHIYNPDNGRYRFTFYTKKPITNVKLNWFDDSVKLAK
jgi:hypothetical protein